MLPSRLHVLPWDRPLVGQAAAWLAADWSGGEPLDLSSVLVIVPTRQSGRRLRESLAALAAERDQGLFPPRVETPERVLAESAAGPDVATTAESLLAWSEVLRTIELADFAEVFPVPPPTRNFAWTTRLAREFQRLAAMLAENGLRLRDPADAARFGLFPETARWRQLARLESLYDAALARRERRDPPAARIAQAAAPSPPVGCSRIVLLGTPDPLPLLLRLLGQLASHLPVEVVVFGPAGEDPGAGFDAWGRPRPEVWSRREPAWTDFSDHVHVASDPGAQASRMVEAATRYAEPARLLAAGIADREILAPLHHALHRAGLVGFDPEGRILRHEPLYRILAGCLEFARDPQFSTVEMLARCPEVLRWLQTNVPALGGAAILDELDRLHAKHLPVTFEAARAHAGSKLAGVLDAFARLRDDLTRHPFPENIRRALLRIHEQREFDLADPTDARAAAAAARWNDVATRLADAAGLFPGTAPLDVFELSLQEFVEDLQAEEKPPGALELQGWLELLWEDAPHLVVAGFNDGRVPDAIVGDPFLPETLRERLGLKTNAIRLARDAYLFCALAACRERHGRLDVLFGKVNAAGDPLRPSRLLLACDDTALPARVQSLFRPVPGEQAATPWHRAFVLAPPAATAPITRLSVTSLRGYLRCPFRFYLGHILRLETVDPLKSELDQLDFGTLCHGALEALGRDPRLRECTDETLLRAGLLAELDQIVRQRFGRDIPVPLQVQLESARQRLGRVAVVHARERAAGWVIEQVELPFALPVGGITVTGKIDRIERHAESGEVRVLDYKTSDTPKAPQDAHVRPLKKNEDPATIPSFAQFLHDGRTMVWLDLQLPIYLHALRAQYGDAITPGYFHMPLAVTQTAIEPWANYHRSWHEESWRCAEGIVHAVQAGEFWPPAELDPEVDDFASLFHQGARESIAWPPTGFATR